MSAEQRQCGHPVRRIACYIASERYPTGSLAALRRLDPDKPDGAPFWWLVGRYMPSAFDNGCKRQALAATVRGMAVAYPFHQPLRGRRRLGEAMAEAEASEMRLLRLLRLRQHDLPDELRRLARLMASRGDAGRFDWSDAYRLLYWQGRFADTIRHDIARDYYRKQYHLQNPKESAA